MKFKSNLSEGIFLRRYCRFLVEMALANKKRRMLYCPNLSPLPACEVLGSRLWFSGAPSLSSEQLEILELIEVDEGEKVLINPEYANLMVRESVHQGKISELKDYRFLYQLSFPAVNHLELLLKENGEQCFLYIEPLFYVENGIGFLKPTSALQTALQELLYQKSQGHQAFLLFAAMHTGIQALKLSDAHSNNHSKMNLLDQAKSLGLDMMSFGVEISLQEAVLGARITNYFSENIISR